MATDGDMLALSSQGASLATKERDSTSGVPIVLQSCDGDASRSASSVADSNARQVIPTSVGYQGSVNPPRPRFYVELKEGETTIVSWKEIIKGSQTFACEDPTSGNPSHAATKKATSADVFQVPANRFSSVIADIGRGIEQLYKGVDSEGEDEYVSMDDYYDTKDSFIDDSELDEYFQVDTIKPKHTGFFVSKRTLEVDEAPRCLPLQPLPPPPVHLQKKRKRNITEHSREMGEIPKENGKVSLALTAATSRTPRPTATGVKTTGSIVVKTCEQSVIESVIRKLKKRVKSVRSLTESSLVETSEQCVIPNLKKRLKSVQSKRDSHAENTTRLSSDFTSRENENVQELKGERAKDGRPQDLKPETINLVNSEVATCLVPADAEQLDGPKETLGAIDNTRLGSHGLQNVVCPPKGNRKKQKTVKIGEEYFRKKDDLTDRGTESMGRKRPAPSRPTLVSRLLTKGVPPKDKQIVKSSKQGTEDGTSKEKQKQNHHAAFGKRLSVEDARRILVGVGTKHGIKFAKKMRLTLAKAPQPKSTV